MDYTPLVVLGGGLIRSISGWLKSSLSDGQINELEWRQLGVTVVRVGLLSAVALYFPGVDLSAFEATAIAIGGDIVLLAVKKFAPKKKR